MAQIAGEAKRVAVLGIAPESKVLSATILPLPVCPSTRLALWKELCMPVQADRPAHYVAQSLQASGVKIIPVPVYYPDVQTILGQKVYRTLASIPDKNVDIVDVFRRAEDLAPHLEDILSIMPKVLCAALSCRAACPVQRC